MLQINASIAEFDTKIWCAYRTRHLYKYDAENFIAELGPDLSPVSNKRLIPENNNTAFEDIRLFAFDGKLLAFYNYLPFAGVDAWRSQYQIGFGEIDLATGLVKDQISLTQLSTRYHEKNWSPYIMEEELFMVTDLDPFLRIIRLGRKGQGLVPEEIFRSTQRTTPWSFGELRGGTPLIAGPGPADDWLYGFVHSFLPDQQGFERYYFYTVIRYDHQNKFFQYHPEPLTYDDPVPDEEYEMLWECSNGKRNKVIFPMGIMRYGEGVTVSFGKDDVCSHTQYFSWEQINGFFK